MQKVKLLLTLEIDEETGETKCLDRKIINDDIRVRKPSVFVKDNDPTPKITLEDNKLTFNQAAVDLLKIEPGDRYEVKYEKKDKQLIPILGNQEVFKTAGGNKVTKSMTISFRGKANDRLSEYGSIFVLEPHPTRVDIYLLKGDKTPTPKESSVPEPIDDEDEVDVNDLVDDTDTEISAFDFNSL